ncbi:MAG: hypothetical protein SWQ30_03370 [Thermodesulfobacteriota bacterium]|nr:hypothetical protein [Thermodesulfobacteriota bacterium]
MGRFRIIYRLGKRVPIEIVALGPRERSRERIYEETYRIVSRKAENH